MTNMNGNGMRLSRKWMWITGIAIIVILLGVGGWCAWSSMNNNDTKSINSSEYQAVFLTNGQVYFGKIASINKTEFTLDHIYYLQVQQSVQPASSGSSNTSTSGTASSNNSQVSLAKLGNELHGPEDHMYIERSQVLFWENLKDSGKVVQAIKTAEKQ